ncbi:MAG: hypothetical protein NZ898_03710 [Myxococcota bacterium]|nr:hypothetical protein [Myxococcota bacterium]MDW8361215.1 hypothetical protein [Myxococcales bacterium]
MEAHGGSAVVLACACVALVLVLLGAFAVLGLLRRGRERRAENATDGERPVGAITPASSTTVTVVLAFGPDHAPGVRASVQALAGRMGHRGSARDAALELLRALPEATHGWIGTEPEPLVAPVDDPRALLVGFAVRARRALFATAAASVADAIAVALRTIGSARDDDLHDARVWILAPSSDRSARTLTPLRAGSAPGTVACRFCGKSMAIYDTTCPSCGAPAPR